MLDGNKQKRPRTGQVYALRVIYPAIIAALLLIGKQALALIPNVEVVTVFIMVCAFTFPPAVTLVAILVFCTGQWLIYGFGYWVVSYYIHWMVLAAVSCCLKLIQKVQTRAIAATCIAVLLTTAFGVQTSAVDAFFASGWSLDFFTYFTIIYLRGIWLFVTHIVSNLVVVSLLFTPLSISLKRVVSRHF